VVALFAVFQKNPMGIMAHASRNLKSIEEVLKGGTLAIQSGLPYARLLRKQFGFDHVKIVPSTGGDLTAFLNDENFAQQCFIMDEPLEAKRLKVDVTVFPVSDIGYNPYTTVLAASAESLRKDPERAKNMVAAVREGWRTYLDNPADVNERMRALNPTISKATFAATADAQRVLIEADPLGKMTKERWDTLGAQLKDLGDIAQAPDAASCFQDL
jgi:NitT/TauT family transport system substrate-binding protein